MNSVNVESEPVNSDQGDEKTFINKLLGEMKSQFNKSEHKIDYMETEEDVTNEVSSKSSQVDVDLVKAEVDMSTNEASDYDIEDSVPSHAEEQSNDNDLDDKPRIVLLFKKPNNESPNKSKEGTIGRRSLRNKHNSFDERVDETVLKRSSRRRSKDCESVLQSAIARKEKSYNESSKPQRLTRQLKPTQKILENLAFAKQEKIKVKSPKNTEKKQYDSENDLPHSDDNNILEVNCKRNKKHLKASKRNTKRTKTSYNNESDKESDSDQSLSPDIEPNLDVIRNTRRSQRISSSRNKEELDESPGPSPNIADQANDFPDDPECSLVGAQLIASRLCLCTQKTKLFADTNENDEIFCTALDSIGEKLIGCSRKVDIKKTSLQRPSQRVPYVILCDLHKNRMLRHNCCPSCGIFCTQVPS